MASKAKRGGANHGLTPIASAVVLAVVGFAPVAPAAAQAAATPAAPAASAAADGQQLQSIIVTANRRVEKLEKVPQSISVIGAEELERNNVREFQDLVDLAPALTISTGTQVGTNSINMRGIGTTSNNLGIEGDVAIIVDDVPYAQPQQAFKDLNDVARVEVLKGPQSTLFGKSAIAGAIVVTTAPIGSGPTRGKFSTYLTNDGEYRVSGTISGRVSDKVGLRISASKNDFKGLLHNLTNDSYMNGSIGENVNAKMEWTLTPDLDVALTGFYSNTVTSGNANALIFWDGRNGSLIKDNVNLDYAHVYAGITPSKRNRDIRLDSETSLAQKEVGGALRINYLFPAGTALANHSLTSITSVDRNTGNDKRDNDSTDLLLGQYYGLTSLAGVTSSTPSGNKTPWTIDGHSTFKTATQDLRLTSPDSGNFRYLAGLWYMRTSTDRDYLRGVFGIKPSNYTNYATTSAATNTALYANSTWEFMPKHTLGVGGRFNQEVSDYTFETILALASSAANNTPYTVNPKYTAPQHKESAFTGKLSYSYEVNPGTIAYAAYSTGRKGVAYDMTSGANNANVFTYMPLAAETAKGYELGFKSNLWNNRATFSAAVFQTTFDNYQASSTQTFADGSSASVLFGIKQVRTRGAEFDFRALVTKDLTVNASYAYTEAGVTDWPYAACYSTSLTTQPNCNQLGDPLRPTVRSVTNGAGFVMPNAPRHKGAIGAQYNSQLGGFKTSYNIQARSQSDVQGNINQNPALARPGFTVIDVGASLATANNAYKFSFGVKNLFDQQYATGGGGNIVTLTPPTGASSSSSVANTGWKPARDAFRYFWVRFDANF